MEPPSRVRNARAVGITGGVRVTWAAPASAGGSRITGYEYRVNNVPWKATTSRNVTIKALSGAQVTVSVRAMNAAGTGGSWTVTARAR
jgi:hypothetical protein